MVVFSPLFLFPRERFAWVLLVIPLLWILRGALRGRFLERTLLDIPLFIILAQLLLSTVFAANPAHSFSKVAGLLWGIGLYYAVVALLRTGKLLKAGIFLFLCGGFLFALVGMMGMFTFKVKHLTLLMKIKESLPRVDFNLPGAELGFSPNAVGGILLLIVPVFMAMLYGYLPRRMQWLSVGPGVTAKGKPVLVFLIVGLLATSGVMLLTQSRGSWVGLAAAVLILLLTGFRKRKALWIGIGLLFLVLSFVLLPSLLNVEQVKLTAQQAEGTLFFRVMMWDRAFPWIAAHPLLGIGLNEFRYLPEIKYDVSHAHNKLVHIAVELGIPAAAAYLALLILVGVMVSRSWKSPGPGWAKLAVLGLGCGMLAHAIYEITDVIPFGAKVGIFPWLSLALIAALYRFLEDRKENSEQGDIHE